MSESHDAGTRRIHASSDPIDHQRTGVLPPPPAARDEDEHARSRRGFMHTPSSSSPAPATILSASPTAGRFAGAASAATSYEDAPPVPHMWPPAAIEQPPTAVPSPWTTWPSLQSMPGVQQLADGDGGPQHVPAATGLAAARGRGLGGRAPERSRSAPFASPMYINHPAGGPAVAGDRVVMAVRNAAAGFHPDLIPPALPTSSTVASTSTASTAFSPLFSPWGKQGGTPSTTETTPASSTAAMSPFFSPPLASNRRPVLSSFPPSSTSSDSPTGTQFPANQASAYPSGIHTPAAHLLSSAPLASPSYFASTTVAPTHRSSHTSSSQSPWSAPSAIGTPLDSGNHSPRVLLPRHRSSDMLSYQTSVPARIPEGQPLSSFALPLTSPLPPLIPDPHGQNFQVWEKELERLRQGQQPQQAAFLPEVPLPLSSPPAEFRPFASEQQGWQGYGQQQAVRWSPPVEQHPPVHGYGEGPSSMGYRRPAAHSLSGPHPPRMYSPPGNFESGAQSFRARMASSPASMTIKPAFSREGTPGAYGQTMQQQQQQDPRRSPTKLQSSVPAKSMFTMWAGNVPSDATHEELETFLVNRPAPPASVIALVLDLDPTGSSTPPSAKLLSGLESLHIISRSNCLFANYVSEQHLKHAISVTHGQILRPGDPRCKPFVCRVRKVEDDLRSGVGGQRGVGMHRNYVAERQKAEHPHDPRLQEPQQAGGAPPRQQPKDEDDEGSGSGRSTTSSFLEHHFPVRYFVLKSHSERELDYAVQSGRWTTQGHNETVLDQAFHTASAGVFIIFSVNKSGEWYGFARMAGPIRRGGGQSPDHPQLQVPSTSTLLQRRRSSSLSHLEDRFTAVGLSGGPGTPDAVHGEPVEGSDLPSFALEWISLRRTPFVRTRHIFNSFNSGREVKISRDGTEVEPMAGEALLRELASPGSPASSIHPAYHPPRLGGGIRPR